MKLSVIIPAYNEEHRLPKALNNYLSYLYQQNYDWELIVVNDGSSDRSGQLVREFAIKENRVKLIEFTKNQGKGAAVRAGLLAAQGEYRLFLDADNATTINHLDLVWPRFAAGCSLVIGSRHPKDAPGAKIKITQPGWKSFLGKAGNLLIRRLAAPGIHDTQCGFKAMTAEFASVVLPKTISNRWALDVELIALARQHGFRLGIVPVVWTHVEESKVGLKGYILMLKELLVLKWKNRKKIK